MYNYCRKKGYYARTCKTKNTFEANVAVVTKDSDVKVAFLGSLSGDTLGSPWMMISVDNHKEVFKIDTGADVTAVPVKLYNQGHSYQKLKRNLMKQQGSISKVEVPTAWCAPMVVVPKRTGTENLH